ncbi:TPA: integrase domain-containing protein [Escherichia coli]|uniref:Integrase n=2 Tax=Escherichia coli TaxID=562 RepID=A0A3K0WCH5_ECOLX|nr:MULTISPECIES: integrase domain-containing protein [Enterobacteriaceae]EBF4524227.1 integrase [Salmonella enterica subsp. enterica serovar Infantis]EBF8070302.1 integrase [Salmonella enterica subsp. enterica serovar Enteritidis]EBH7136052.1 integrase [Salmonella enterica]EBV7459754.1 integrase [Salmonella enterica subsp. enterica serovar Mbandaka]ECY3186940.1 integrase [Salmonella enterica subsp. enterica serovar Schwarzengrund]EED8154783.1 integrase [Salmonella enterica subsp. enterica ser
MSRREKLLKKDLVAHVRKEKGSFKKLSDYTRIMHRFAETLARLNVQISSAAQLKVRHIELYMNSRTDVSKRTRENEMSAIRAVLRQVGKNKLADPSHPRLSNKALGISGESRKGTKSLITDDRFREILQRIEQKDKGLAATVKLSRYLGLRNEEAIQSAKSLKTWKQALERGDEKLRVIFGTKGGRERMTTIVDRNNVIEAVNYAIKYAGEHDGRLIDRGNLKSAMNYYLNSLRRYGEMKGGDETPHSFRYSYAASAMKYHIMNGYSYHEALALTSMDLGHGDGRGRYIEQVYCQLLGHEE